MADAEFDVELDNGIENPASPYHCDLGAAATLPGLIWPMRRSMKMADTGLLIGNGMETGRKKGNKKK